MELKTKRSDTNKSFIQFKFICEDTDNPEISPLWIGLERWAHEALDPSGNPAMRMACVWATAFSKWPRKWVIFDRHFGTHQATPQHLVNKCQKETLVCLDKNKKKLRPILVVTVDCELNVCNTHKAGTAKIRHRNKIQ